MACGLFNLFERGKKGERDILRLISHKESDGCSILIIIICISAFV